MSLTSGAEWAVIGSGRAVTQVAVVLFYALPSVPAVYSKTGTVALATGLDPRCDLGPLLQVEGDAIHSQGPDTAEETPLPPCSTWGTRERWHQRGYVSGDRGDKQQKEWSRGHRSHFEWKSCLNLFSKKLISWRLEEATDVTLIDLTVTLLLEQPSTCLISSLIKTILMNTMSKWTSPTHHVQNRCTNARNVHTVRQRHTFETHRPKQVTPSQYRL